MQTEMNPAPIVVGVDEEPQSLLALRWAAREASASGRPLRVVHALDIDPTDEPAALEAHARDLAGVAERMVREAAPEVPVLTRVEDGAPYDVLTVTAKDAALLVLGSHGRGMLGRMLLGSVSAAIGAEPPCPVAVVRAHTPATGDPDAPVVVGVDGTPSSLAALEAAAGYAARHGARLVAVTSHREVHHPVAGTTEHQRAAREEWLRALVAPVRERHPGLPITSMATTDRPAQTLVERSATARLVVVGTGGRPGRAGSVGQALLHHSWSPVLIVPAP